MTERTPGGDSAGTTPGSGMSRASGSGDHALGRRGMLAAVPLSAMFQSGGGGLPPAEPLDFATLERPSSPNTCLGAPPGFPRADLALPPLPADGETAWRALLALGDRFPRTTRLAAWPEQQQAQWVVRSAVLNFPDIMVAEVTGGPAGSGLFLYSRSLFGYSDFGVNRRRVEAWAAALHAALGAGRADRPRSP
jgi:uncharacterized protein (DUF1499 family)